MAQYQDDSMGQPRGMMRRAPAPQQTAPMATRRSVGGVDAGEMGRPWNQTFAGGGAHSGMVRAGGGPAMTGAPQAPVAGAGGGTLGMGGMVVPAGAMSGGTAVPMTPAARPGVSEGLPVYTGTTARYNPNMAG